MEMNVLPPHTLTYRFIKKYNSNINAALEQILICPIKHPLWHYFIFRTISKLCHPSLNICDK